MRSKRPPRSARRRSRLASAYARLRLRPSKASTSTSTSRARTSSTKSRTKVPAKGSASVGYMLVIQSTFTGEPDPLDGGRGAAPLGTHDHRKQHEDPEGQQQMRHGENDPGEAVHHEHEPE